MLKVSCQELKNKTGTIIPIFDIQIDTNLFLTSLLVDKLQKAITTTGFALFKSFFILKKSKSLKRYISFYATVIKLG